MEKDEGIHRQISQRAIMKYKFEILSEENEEIDIDSIEELYINNIKSVGESETKCWTGRNLDVAFANKINDLIKAVKQLNKQVNEPNDNHIPRID